MSRLSASVRLPAQLPVQSATVRLEVALYRLRCCNPSCGRKTFAEPIAAPFARRTNRVREPTRLIGHAAGSFPAERSLARLGLPQNLREAIEQTSRTAPDTSPPTALSV
jgi:hypothetical protein